MKFDIDKPLTRSSRRVLTSVTEAFFGLLCEQSFESISVSEICDRAGYPRATFYNYFDDKYDLLNFGWSAISKMVGAEEYSRYPLETCFDIYFERLYDLVEENEDKVGLMMSNNMEDGYFLSSCRIFLAKSIKTIIEGTYSSAAVPVPMNMLAEHYANTLLLVFRHRFGRKNTGVGREETRANLYYLISGGQKII